MKYDVFISYSRVDSDVVREFANRITDAGYRVWMDVDGIESGDEFKDKIVSAIEDSRVFLFFSSEASNASSWTVKEVNVAVVLKKNIIPVRLDDSAYNKSILFDLAGFDYVMCNSHSSLPDAMAKLMHSLDKKIGESGAMADGIKAKVAAKVNSFKNSGILSYKYIVLTIVLLFLFVVCPFLLFLAVAVVVFVLFLVVICVIAFGGSQGPVENIKEQVVVRYERLEQETPVVMTIEKAVDTMLSAVMTRQINLPAEEKCSVESDAGVECSEAVQSYDSL